MKKAAPVITIVLAGLLWGCISLFTHNLTALGFSVIQMSAMRQLIAAILFAVLILITGPEQFRFKLKDIWIFICSGVISISLFGTCYFYTIEQSQASVAVVFLYTSPIFVMIISAIVFREKITLQKIIALVLTFAGCVCASGLIGSSYSIRPLIILTGLASGLFYGLYTIFCNFGLKKYSSLTVTFWTFVFGMIATIPISHPAELVSRIIEVPQSLLYFAGIGIFNTFLPYLCYTWGLKYVEGSKAAILVAVEVLSAAVIGMTVWQEPHSFVKILGIALIFASVVLLNIKFTAKKRVKKNRPL